MNLTKSFTTAAALLLLLPASVVFAQKQKQKSSANVASSSAQKYILKTGSQFTYDTRVASEQTMSMMGQENTSKTLTTMRTYVNVKEASGDGYTLGMNSDTAVIQLKMDGMMGKKDTTMKMREVAALKNNYKISPTGKIISQSNEGSDAAANTAKAMLQQFTGSGKSEVNLVEYPDVPMTKGYSWTKSSTDTNRMGNNGEGGNMLTATTTRYTFDGMLDTLGAKCGRILIKSEKMNVSGTIKQPGMGGEMMEIQVEGDGSLKGAYYFELATGMPVAILNNTQLDTRMTISGQMQMVMPVSSDIKSTIVRAKKK